MMEALAIDLRCVYSEINCKLFLPGAYTEIGILVLGHS